MHDPTQFEAGTAGLSLFQSQRTSRIAEIEGADRYAPPVLLMNRSGLSTFAACSPWTK
jgi:hypothetical protein